MQIVINIPTELYERLMESNADDYDGFIEGELVDFIQRGTPLPKGYGRLIDADKLEYTCNSDECGMLTGCNHCQYHVITEDEIDSAPTIIDRRKNENNR